MFDILIFRRLSNLPEKCKQIERDAKRGPEDNPINLINNCFFLPNFTSKLNLFQYPERT